METRGVFLDISKAFDRVWHDGLLFKLKQNGVSGNLLGLIKIFLNDRVARVVLNGKTSDWERTRAGVPRGSILGPLFFLIYINVLAKSNVKLFADDICLFSIVSDPLETANVLNEDVDKIGQWVEQWKMGFNLDPTKQAQEVVFSKKPQESFHPNLYFSKLLIGRVQIQKHLELKLDKKLRLKELLQDKFAKINRKIGILKKLSGF